MLIMRMLPALNGSRSRDGRRRLSVGTTQTVGVSPFNTRTDVLQNQNIQLCMSQLMAVYESSSEDENDLGDGFVLMETAAEVDGFELMEPISEPSPSLVARLFGRGRGKTLPDRPILVRQDTQHQPKIVNLGKRASRQPSMNSTPNSQRQSLSSSGQMGS